MPRKRKIIVYAATSVDGFIARLDGSVDWLDRPRPKGNYGMDVFYRSIDICVMGRKTYDLSVRFGMPNGYAGKENYVFSRTLKEAASPKVLVVNEDVTSFAERLRAKKGKNIWLVGGAELVAAFLDAGEVDEFIIHMVPKMIGEGIPLVAACHRNLQLKLLSSKTFPDGVVRLDYAVGQDGAGASGKLTSLDLIPRNDVGRRAVGCQNSGQAEYSRLALAVLSLPNLRGVIGSESRNLA